MRVAHFQEKVAAMLTWAHSMWEPVWDSLSQRVTITHTHSAPAFNARRARQRRTRRYATIKSAILSQGWVILLFYSHYRTLQLPIFWKKTESNRTSENRETENRRKKFSNVFRLSRNISQFYYFQKNWKFSGYSSQLNRQKREYWKTKPKLKLQRNRHHQNRFGSVYRTPTNPHRCELTRRRDRWLRRKSWAVRGSCRSWIAACASERQYEPVVIA